MCVCVVGYSSISVLGWWFLRPLLISNRKEKCDFQDHPLPGSRYWGLHHVLLPLSAAEQGSVTPKGTEPLPPAWLLWGGWLTRSQPLSGLQRAWPWQRWLQPSGECHSVRGQLSQGYQFQEAGRRWRKSNLKPVYLVQGGLPPLSPITWNVHWSRQKPLSPTTPCLLKI